MIKSFLRDLFKDYPSFLKEIDLLNESELLILIRFFESISENEKILLAESLEDSNLLKVFYVYLTNKNYFEEFRPNEYIKAYYFLYKRNFKTTNIQFAELASLIRKYSSEDNKPIGKDILFVHTNEFQKLVEGFNNSIYQITQNSKFEEIIKNTTSAEQLIIKLIIAYETEKESSTKTITFNPIDLFDLLINEYKLLFKRIAIVDCFYSSSIIYLPSSVILDLSKITAYSGYINSSGHLLYVKNVEKAQKKTFLENLYSYIDKQRNKKTRLAVFSHEDSLILEQTSEHNPLKNQIKEEQKSGLSDVKVYLEKFYMGDDSLLSIIYEALKKLSENPNLSVPKIDNLQWQGNFDNSSIIESTIWLQIEHSLGHDLTKHGDLKYYICYEQLYKNDNQLHTFDEYKPAWKSSTTIPHTLIGAMLNIAINNIYPPIKQVNILDPFLGTGTSLIESLKYDNVNFWGFDLDNLSPILVDNNIDLIFTNKFEWKEFDFQLLNFGDRAFDLLNELGIDFGNYPKGEYDIDSSKITKFKSLPFSDKIIIYLLFKTNIKNSGALIRSTKDNSNFLAAFQKFKNLIQKEAFILKAQLFELEELYENSYSTESHFNEKQGKFSKKFFLNPKKAVERYHQWKENDQIQICDVLELKSKIGATKFDIIITDPPYGLNVAHKNLELAKVYNKFINVFFSVLSDDGQIIMALPDKSHSGKRSPFFTHKDVVVKNFILQARENNFEVINIAEVIPKIGINPPYYWEADKALRRSIIHFRFKRIKKIGE